MKKKSSPPPGWFSRMNSFLYRDLWEKELEELSRAKAMLLGLLRLLIVIWRKFTGDLCLTRASALAYATILSIVPLFAFAFSILKGFGVQRRLEPLILERVAPASHETVAKVMSYIDRTNVGTLGAIAVAGLAFTAISILGNIEKAFNDIWGVKKGRSLLRRISDYISVVIIAPLFLLAALSLTTTLQSHAIVSRLTDHALFTHARYLGILAGPYLCVWIAFTCLYFFMPHTRVRISSALLGGIVAGTLWQAAQWGYVQFQFGMAKYNAIYGAMAQFPILLVWVYFSWVIVLLGAEIAAGHQNAGAGWIGGAGLRFSGLYRESLALSAATAITRRFVNGEPPLTASGIASLLRAPPLQLNETLSLLCDSGFLVKAHDEEDVYLPVRDPSGVRVAEIVRTVRTSGDLRRLPVIESLSPRLREALEILERSPECALGEMRLGELCDKINV